MDNGESVERLVVSGLGWVGSNLFTDSSDVWVFDPDSLERELFDLQTQSVASPSLSAQSLN